MLAVGKKDSTTNWSSMMLELHLMREQVAEEIIVGEGLHLGRYEGDQWVILQTPADKEVGDELKVIEWLPGGRKGGADGVIVSRH
jgi:hypothetical protein